MWLWKWKCFEKSLFTLFSKQYLRQCSIRVRCQKQRSKSRNCAEYGTVVKVLRSVLLIICSFGIRFHLSFYSSSRPEVVTAICVWWLCSILKAIAAWVEYTNLPVIKFVKFFGWNLNQSARRSLSLLSLTLSSAECPAMEENLNRKLLMAPQVIIFPLHFNGLLPKQIVFWNLRCSFASFFIQTAFFDQN